MDTETRLGRLRGYDPAAEQAFTRRAAGANPIALELDRLATLKGLPAQTKTGQGMAAEDAAYSDLADQEVAKNAEIERDYKGDQAQNLPNEAYMHDMPPPDPNDPNRDHMNDYIDAMNRGYTADAYSKMDEVERATADRLDQRVDDMSDTIGQFARNHPGTFILDPDDGSIIFTQHPDPAEQAAMDELMRRRNRVIDHLSRLGDRAYTRGGQ